MGDATRAWRGNNYCQNKFHNFKKKKQTQHQWEVVNTNTQFIPLYTGELGDISEANVNLPIIGTEEDTHEEDESDTGPPPTEKQPPPPFIVGEGLPVILSKLVQKIQKDEFIDMAELLKDNIEADRR